MWSFPGNMPNYYPGLRDILPDPKWRVICFSDLGNMPKYYSTKYHYRNLHEV